ncbi:DNA methyltransferase [uncultured Subdoligranulum sp.]|uniref:DNA methyltransferase n=1 Tax=uncultured Subdoligranulum sp. TaxID=512298 RepID=UPI0025DB6D78|nr:DNA methyltransferase [uncultured Subdoligranulum sp.]
METETKPLALTYAQFLERKIDVAPLVGLDVQPDQLSSALKPHQRDSVLWALRGGRRALFAAFGLGKTVMQLEWARIVAERTGGQVIIVAPLNVRREFYDDATHILHQQPPVYVKTQAEADAIKARVPVVITNYERVRDGDIDPRRFAGVTLDEAATLRSFGSKTYQVFLDKFKSVRYKLVNTATPSPNRYKELIHYAGFLEIMDTGQALTRWFKRDSTKANNLTLYPGRERGFWIWCASWGLFLQKPSDLGYSDEGYSLPPLEVRYHRLQTDLADAGSEPNGQMKLMRDAAFGLRDAAREKRESIAARVAEAKRIIDEAPADEHFVIWHDLEAERHALTAALPECVDIHGTMDLEERERRVEAFAYGETRLFATKKSLSGSGCNFQRYCHRAIFLGIDYEFNDFIQAIHRIYRFLQTRPVVIDIIYMDSEEEILRVLKQKWKQYEELTETMAGIIREYGLGTAAMESLKRTIGVERVEVTGEHYRAINNDCVEELKNWPDNSVDMILTSIPFGNHYEYSPSYNDFGHNPDDDAFFQQMEYLTPNLLRVLRPGRVAAIHVKDRILFGNATGLGMPSVEPFHADTIAHFRKHGFVFFGMVTIVTDVVRENNQTYRLGWTEQCKDGSKMGVGCEEYLLLFRKLPTDTSKAYADVPVKKSKDAYTRAQWQIDAHGFWRSSGDRLVTKAELQAAPVSKLQDLYRRYSRQNVYSYEDHVALAKQLDADGRLPATFMVCAPGSWTDSVWDDINRMRTLNTSQRLKKRELHICPLQLDVVERAITRWSNPGDLILDPFGGLMTVPYMAVKMDRRGAGIELNSDYFRDGLGYLQEAEDARDVPTLFDLVEGVAT